jgi:hypothetical membrane protein
MSRRKVIFAAVSGNLLLWGAVIGFAAARPDYSSLYDAISELGALRAPANWAFNILGFFLPGCLLAYAGWGIGRAVENRPAIPVILVLVASSLVFTGLFPADLADRGNLLTRLHIVSSMFGIAAPLAWGLIIFRTWKGMPALAMSAGAALVIFFGVFALYGLLPYPGLVQRLTFALVFGWHALAALLLPADGFRRLSGAP